MSFNVNPVRQQVALSHSNSPSQTKMTKWQKAAKVAKQIFLGIIAVTLLFYQAPLLIIGFIVGIALKDHMKKMVESIKAIWKRHPYIVFGAGVIASVFAFSAVILAGAFFTGGILGVKLMEAPPIQSRCCTKRKTLP